MSISFYNFNDLHHNEFKKNIMNRFQEILDESSFVEGKYNSSFESKFAKMQNAKYCALVANGTDALEISLIVSGVKPGDKVGVPGITFYATAEAVLNIGATPVFIDIDPTTGLICPESLSRTIKSHDLKAVMPVHIFGLPAPIKEIEKICNPKNISIIEDAAQAQGTFVDGKPVGSTNNLTTFSFYPTKNLSAFGDAGCILTQNEDQFELIKCIRNHGRGKEFMMGRNSRCDHMQAAVLDLKLDEIDKLNKQRKAVAQKYYNALKELPVKLLGKQFIETSSWHLYPVQFENSALRIKAAEAFKAQNIGSAPFYERALSQEPSLSQYEGEDKNAKELAGRSLCLPIHPFISDEDIQKIANTLKSVF